MIYNKIKNFFKQLSKEEQRGGLLPVEWAILAYILFTSFLMVVYYNNLVDVDGMIRLRVGCSLLMLVGVITYRVFPSRIVEYVRTAAIMTTLTEWYPDIFEFTRLFANQDHIFAGIEQMIFGFQPSLTFSQNFPQIWLSEPLYMGYASYFFMSLILLLWVIFVRPELNHRCAFVTTASFLVFYVVYIFLPVAGPQYYYLAPGVDAAAGVFPDVEHYFHEVRELYPAAGQEGFFHTLINVAHAAGERPIAAFPSSHVGIATVILMFAAHYRAWRVFFFLLPFYLLLCVSTVYIHAHYVIDAVAGFVSAIAVYYILNYIFNKVWKHDV